LVSFKDLDGASKQNEFIFTSKGNYWGCFSNNQVSRGSKQDNSKEEFLGMKIEGLHASLRFEDFGVVKFQKGLKIGGLGVIT